MTSAYLMVGEKYAENTEGVFYEALEAGEKSSCTRKLNEINIERDEVVEKLKKATARKEITLKLLCSADRSAVPSGTTIMTSPTSQRIPTLPSLRSEQ